MPIYICIFSLMYATWPTMNKILKLYPIIVLLHWQYILYLLYMHNMYVFIAQIQMVDFLSFSPTKDKPITNAL